MEIQATKYLSMEELEAGLEYIRQSPKDEGELKLIVRRPQIEEREVLQTGQLDLDEGLVGDTWKTRSSGQPEFGRQVTLMNARTIDLLAQEQERWPLAGNQLFVDLDLSVDNLPPGAQLQVGLAVLEVSSLPHTGCNKFSSRFGLEALKFVNSPVGKGLRLRGINTRIVQPGLIQVGDVAKRL